MILDGASWMNIRRFRALHDAGASYAEIAAECGCDWRTVKKYLESSAPAVPPTGSPRAGTQPRVIDPFTEVIDAWLRADIGIRASVIHERLVDQYRFGHTYQRVKMYVAEARPRIAAELAESDENPLRGLHRRFEVVPGAQAQVDWGEEGGLLAPAGIAKVYSFHLTLSHSRDPFCCFTDTVDLATFWDCHRRAFAHFGGVPGTIVYENVPRHIFILLWPTALCGRRRLGPVMSGCPVRRRPHNVQSDESQLRSDSSDRQTGRGWDPAEAPGGSVFRSASIFARVLISA
jgi:transposase